MAKSNKKKDVLIEIDLTNIVTSPDLEGVRTKLDGIYKVIGNLFFNMGSIPVHDKGKILYYEGKVMVSTSEINEMAAILNSNPINSLHYQKAISEYFNAKIKENG